MAADDREEFEVEVEVEESDFDESDSRKVLVDASNVAHATERDTARLVNIELVARKLQDKGFDPLIVADAALRHQIDRPKDYERLISQGRVHQAPAGTDADYFILSFARELNAWILTNDRFRDRAEQFSPERDRIIRYMIVEGEVVLERRSRRRKD